MLRIRLGHVIASMQRAGVVHAPRIAHAMYDALGRSLGELLWMLVRPRDLAPLAVVDDASRNLLGSAIDEGRGVVLAASHTGNWDLAACAIASHVPLMIVTKRLSAAWLDRIWQEGRRRYGIVLVEPEGATQRVKAHLARGGAVAMMVDQVPLRTSHAERALFLGAEALADRAPAALAARFDAPLLVTAAFRDPAGRQQLRVLGSFSPTLHGSSRPNWVLTTTAATQALLTTFILEHPADWLWLHRRWKGAPGSASGVTALTRQSVK